jgi:hypothetical protein
VRHPALGELPSAAINPRSCPRLPDRPSRLPSANTCLQSCQYRTHVSYLGRSSLKIPRGI